MTASARAADEFAVTPAQMQGLGITLQRLEQPAGIQGQAYPARVVLPPSQEQVVSAPLAGLVDRVLVSENAMVKSGQPLLRLISPELGELQLKLLEAASKSRLSQKTAQRERMLFADGIIPERRVQEAEVARAGVDRQRREEEMEIVEAYVEATGGLERWRLASQGLTTTRDSARLTQRAYTLGEADLQTLLLARRQAVEALTASEQARVEALRWHYRLLIDAHLILGLADD